MKAKENIRLWFEFYKLAFNDNRCKKEIDKSKYETIKLKK